MSFNLHLSPEGATFIARFEGFKPAVYRCPAGFPTIGYGHKLQSGESFSQITESAALDLLMQDATQEAAPVARALTVPLTQFQADAVISLAFNAGGGSIRRSTLLRYLNQGYFNDAAEQFLRWTKAGGKTSRGLVRRRKAERELFLTGNYGV